jgi:MoaA/NifB/PqqE/SkfB family radical SAM enzyme
MRVSCALSSAGASKLERVRSSEITKDYQRRILAQRVPVAASIELTTRCNLHCAHCYCPPGDREKEFDTEEVKAVFDGLTSIPTGTYRCA